MKSKDQVHPRSQTAKPIIDYLRNNPGSPFILAFLLSLIATALMLSSEPDLAHDLMTVTFVGLAIGIVLQAVSSELRG